jgi:hypothetical protein
MYIDYFIRILYITVESINVMKQLKIKSIN